MRLNIEIKQMAHDFTEEIYKRGYECGKEESITKEKAIDFLEAIGWKDRHDAEMMEQGMYMAWECARRLISDSEFREVFGNYTSDEIIENFPASEAVAKYEEQQKQKEEEICVGDEVILKRENTKAVVCNISKYTDKQPYSILMGDDGMTVYVNKNDITKTGKHYSQIDEVIEQLRRGE
jgi:hypothetical protein